eukprot:5793028-Pyramimonas_sp.AAC.1
MSGLGAPERPRRRPNRTAAGRRAQYRRAEARAVSHLLDTFAALVHRGSEPTRLASALVSALQASEAQAATR